MTTNNVPTPLLHESIWCDANEYREAETKYQEFLAQNRRAEKMKPTLKFSLVDKIALCRQRIQNTLKSVDTPVCTDFPSAAASDLCKRMSDLETDNKMFMEEVKTLTTRLGDVTQRISQLEKSLKDICQNAVQNAKPAAPIAQNGPENDDDIDLFGSDEETEEDKRIKEERLKAYEDKKAKKKAVVAKSSIVLDIKPWDDETDMKAMESLVRKIETEGLKWGAGSLVPLAYGIFKLQIVAIVEDELVSVDWLQEKIQDDISDHVQSVDIAAFNKL